KPKMTKLFNRCCAFFIGSIGLSLLIGEKNTGKEKFKVMAKSDCAVANILHGAQYRKAMEE
ncbi:MAG: hypothetical protein ACI9DG_001516, partial [Oleispira sp.]